MADDELLLERIRIVEHEVNRVGDDVAAIQQDLQSLIKMVVITGIVAGSMVFWYFVSAHH